MEEPKMEDFKKKENTVSAVEQRIDYLMSREGNLSVKEKNELERFKANATLTDEVENARRSNALGKLTEDQRVKMRREDMDKTILGENA